VAVATPHITTRQTLVPTVETAVDTPVLPQYSRRRIAGIWAAAALPMGFLAWVAAPILAGHLNGPNALFQALLICITGGLIWQFVLVAGLLWHEQRTLRWSRVREALWLRAPRSPRTGRRGGRAWLIVVPLIVGTALEGMIPTVVNPGIHDFGTFVGSDAGQAFFSGAWGWLAVVGVLFVFNTVLGEELLFRGLLLPRMNGAFGERDWVANGVLFAGYHLHMPWGIPATLLDTFFLAGPSKRRRSALVGIVVHSAQSVFFFGLLVALVLR
jgi:membrane protease YdiL (CAAX protease family)